MNNISTALVFSCGAVNLNSANKKRKVKKRTSVGRFSSFKATTANSHTIKNPIEFIAHRQKLPLSSLYTTHQNKLKNSKWNFLVEKVKQISVVLAPILTSSIPSLKPRVVAEKSQYYPTPCPVMWGGERGPCSAGCSPEDLL
jgi:hypothetical protein